MDIPQWYNRKLWSASKQSIDGKPVRSQSAGFSNRRTAYTPQPTSGNWANYLKVNNLTLPNRDRGFTYRYNNLSNRPSKSVFNNQSAPYSSNYLNNLSNQISYLGKNNALNSSPLLTFRQKPVSVREKSAIVFNETKPQRIQLSSKIIQPQFVEYEQDFYSTSKKYETVHGNINADRNDFGDPETAKKCIEIEEPLLESLNISISIPPPQNTPRFLGNSSQDNYPKKSILKKTVDIIYQSNNHSNPQPLSVSLKPMISSQPMNKFYEIRKTLQSAPGTKREVRFDMSYNNVIEYSTTD